MANGLSQGIVALFGAAASATVGGIYGWTLNNQLDFPLDYHLTFEIIGVLLCANALITLMSKRVKSNQTEEIIELAHCETEFKQFMNKIDNNSIK